MRHFSVNPLNAPFSEYPLLSAYLDRGGIRLHNWWGVLLYRIGTLVPDLAIEVLSAGNTEGEMRRKLHDYFTAGVRLVWYIDPRHSSRQSVHGRKRVQRGFRGGFALRRRCVARFRAATKGTVWRFGNVRVESDRCG